MALLRTHVALSLYFPSAFAKVPFELSSLVSDDLQGMKRVARVSMALCSQKVGGRKSREKLVPQRTSKWVATSSGLPSATHVLQFPQQSLVSISFQERALCHYFLSGACLLLEDWSLTCESVLAPDHQFLQGDRFSGEVRAYLLNSKRFLLNPSCIGNMDPGKKP